MVRQKSDPDDHVQGWWRGERSHGVGIQFSGPGEGTGNGDAHEQGEDPGERQHGGVHRHQAGGDGRQRPASMREGATVGGKAWVRNAGAE